MSCCVPTGWGTVTKLANVQPGDTVAVWGLGGVGQNTLRAAKMRQANPLIAVDLEEARRENGHGAGRRPTSSATPTKTRCRSSRSSPAAARLRLRVQRRPGRPGAGLVGPGHGRQAHVRRHHARSTQMAPMPLTFMPLQQKSIIGGLYGAISTMDDIPKLVDLAMTGEMKLDKIIEGKFKLEEINDIAEKMERRQLSGRWVCEWD